MPNRYRWFRVYLPAHGPDLEALVEGHPFGPSVNHGFLPAIGTLGSTIQRFFHRTNITVISIDDTGEPTFEQIATVTYTDFALIAQGTTRLLRIENPGRNLRDLFNALEALYGLGFSCQALTFERARPTAVFEHTDAFKLIALKVSGAVIDDDIVARMEFSSPNGITRERLSLLDDFPHQIDSASYELIHQGVSGQLHLSANGTVKVSGRLTERIIALIEQDLPMS